MRNLQRSRTSGAYRRRMQLAARLFRAWCDREDISAPFCFRKPATANALLVVYIQYLFGANYKYADAKYLVLFVQTRWRHLKGKLRTAWDSIESWAQDVPSGNRIPMPLVIMETLFRSCIMRASAQVSHPVFAYRFLAFGVLLRLGFIGLLRPGELFKLRKCDFVLPMGPGLSMVVVIHNPKNRLHMGRTQHVLIEDSVVISWLTWLLKYLDQDALVWPCGLPQARSMLQEMLYHRGLRGTGPLLSSLRPGGATHLYQLGMSIERLQLKGRWKSIVTLHSYIQEAVASLVLLELSPQKLQTLECFVSDLSVLDCAPPVSLPKFLCNGGRKH